jgi:hypothetical protein
MKWLLVLVHQHRRSCNSDLRHLLSARKCVLYFYTNVVSLITVNQHMHHSCWNKNATRSRKPWTLKMAPLDMYAPCMQPETDSEPTSFHHSGPLDKVTHSWQRIVSNALTRPFFIFATEPIVQLLGLYMALTYGLLYCEATTSIQSRHRLIFTSQHASLPYRQSSKAFTTNPPELRD